MVAGRFKVFIGHLTPFIPLSFLRRGGDRRKRGEPPL